jgi:CheY-like chemotaxis protein
MKILLVEDDPFFALRITEYLSDNGIEVTVVKTTQDALAIKLDEYEGAVIDVMLPNDPAASGISAEEARGGCLSGVALARRLLKKNEKLPLVFLTSDVAGGEAYRWTRENKHPLIFKHENRSRLLSALADLGLIPKVERPRVFIVHGHDNNLLAEVKDYIQNTLKWPEPIILRDRPSCGKTLIEKFEEQAGIIDWVFVLISPDEKAFDPKTNDEKRRTRQNVIFELGFFYGLIGRNEGRVIVLKKGDVELPSDIHGVTWIDVSAGVRSVGEDIRRELRC